MKKKRLWLAAGALGFFVLLLFLLVAAESGAPEATIVSFPTAAWYALTTLTTVGYGDLYPVTAAGRAIGVLLQLMSLGVLGAVFGMLFSFLSGRTLPLWRLWRLRRRTWYVFSAPTAEALALARALREEDPRRVLLFPVTGGEPLPDVGMGLSLSIADICQRKSPQTEGYLFCIGPEGAENERLASEFGSRFTRVCCESDVHMEQLPPQQVRFSLPTCCGRLYWDRFPLTGPRERIVLIGDGPYAWALLEQGLLRNVIAPEQAVCYTVFGPFDPFRRNHPFLYQTVSDTPKADRDCVRFPAGPWNGDPAYLLEADRIVLCCESEADTRQIASDLLRYFPVQTNLHARLSSPFSGVATFGSAEELFTPALILREDLDRTAVKLHERYRQSNPSAPAWGDLSDFLRRSNLASADHLSVKKGILSQDAARSDLSYATLYDVFAAASGPARQRYRRIEHERWMRFRLLNGWQYGPVRDDARRLHPLLIPFDRLSEADQAKNDYAWELLRLI